MRERDKRTAPPYKEELFVRQARESYGETVPLSMGSAWFKLDM